jgi:hypothetical protein
VDGYGTNRSEVEMNKIILLVGVLISETLYGLHFAVTEKEAYGPFRMNEKPRMIRLETFKERNDPQCLSERYEYVFQLSEKFRLKLDVNSKLEGDPSKFCYFEKKGLKCIPVPSVQFIGKVFFADLNGDNINDYIFNCQGDYDDESGAYAERESTIILLSKAKAYSVWWVRGFELGKRDWVTKDGKVFAICSVEEKVRNDEMEKLRVYGFYVHFAVRVEAENLIEDNSGLDIRLPMIIAKVARNENHKPTKLIPESKYKETLERYKPKPEKLGEIPVLAR